MSLFVITNNLLLKAALTEAGATRHTHWQQTGSGTTALVIVDVPGYHAPFPLAQQRNQAAHLGMRRYPICNSTKKSERCLYVAARHNLCPRAQIFLPRAPMYAAHPQCPRLTRFSQEPQAFAIAPRGSSMKSHGLPGRMDCVRTLPHRYVSASWGFARLSLPSGLSPLSVMISTLTIWGCQSINLNLFSSETVIFSCGTPFKLCRHSAVKT